MSDLPVKLEGGERWVPLIRPCDDPHRVFEANRGKWMMNKLKPKPIPSANGGVRGKRETVMRMIERLKK